MKELVKKIYKKIQENVLLKGIALLAIIMLLNMILKIFI